MRLDVQPAAVASGGCTTSACGSAPGAGGGPSPSATASAVGWRATARARKAAWYASG